MNRSSSAAGTANRHAGAGTSRRGLFANRLGSHLSMLAKYTLEQLSSNAAWRRPTRSASSSSFSLMANFRPLPWRQNAPVPLRNLFGRVSLDIECDLSLSKDFLLHHGAVQSVATGRRRAAAAAEEGVHNARLSGASPGGSTSMSSKRCRHVSTPIRRRCAVDAKLSSSRSERSRSAWALRTPDEDAAEGRHRDGAARAGLQSEAVMVGTPSDACRGFTHGLIQKLTYSP